MYKLLQQQQQQHNHLKIQQETWSNCVDINIIFAPICVNKYNFFHKIIISILNLQQFIILLKELHFIRLHILRLKQSSIFLE